MTRPDRSRVRVAAVRRQPTWTRYEMIWPGCPALWARIGRALAPGGVFAGQLFGTHDTWAGDPDMTFYARHQVEVLLDGLDILRLEETERDGHAFSGPKHWHTFAILARKPVSKRLSAPASR